MTTTVHKPLLLGAALVASCISAAFMSSSLYTLAPGGWMAFAALALGLVMEILKSGLSVVASEQWREKRIPGLVFSIVFIAVVMLFAVWAGQERFIHGVAADVKASAALEDVRSRQIESELAHKNAELQALSQYQPVIANTDAEKARLADLYDQAKQMRAKMGWTKAEDLERTSIAAVKADIERKENDAARANQEAQTRRMEREQALRAEINDLHKQQVQIASHTKKIVSTSFEDTSWILKLVVILAESAPIYIFWLYGSTQAAQGAKRSAPTDLPTSPTSPLVATPVAPVATPVAAPAVVSTPIPERLAPPAAVVAPAVEESIPEAPVADPDEADSILEVGQEGEFPAYAEEASANLDSTAPVVAIDQQEIPIPHPRVPMVIDSVKALERGSKVSTEFIKGMSVASDAVKPVHEYLAALGLVEKQGRSWVRV